MRFHLRLRAGIHQQCRNLWTRGLVKCYVSHEPSPKKCRDTGFRAVHKLVDDQELSGPQVLLQRPPSADGNNSLDTQLLQRADIRTKIDLARKDAMPTPVASQKRDALL